MAHVMVVGLAIVLSGGLDLLAARHAAADVLFVGKIKGRAKLLLEQEGEQVKRRGRALGAVRIIVPSGETDRIVLEDLSFHTQELTDTEAAEAFGNVAVGIAGPVELKLSAGKGKDATFLGSVPWQVFDPFAGDGGNGGPGTPLMRTELRIRSVPRTLEKGKGRFRIEIQASTDKWSMIGKAIARGLECRSGPDHDGDLVTDSCDQCPNDESTGSCGIKPAGYWLEYDTYAAGCGCTDTDGRNFFVQGETRVEFPGPRPLRIGAGCWWPPNWSHDGDLCVDATTLVEYSCGFQEAVRSTVECEFGCRNGACRCDTDEADSDGGHAPFVRGQTARGGQDVCVECTRYEGTGDLIECVEWGAVPECSGRMLDGCALREFAMVGDPASGRCVDTFEVVDCETGACANGACRACEPENDPFRSEGLDRCSGDLTAIRERSNDPSCELQSDELIGCAVGCDGARGICLCTDTDSRSSAVQGRDSFDRLDVCDGDDLLERWAERSDGTVHGQCVAREERRPCPYGCADGRCMPPPGARPFTFTCVAYGSSSPMALAERVCTLGVIQFVEQLGLSDVVDVRLQIHSEVIEPSGETFAGGDFGLDVQGVPGDMRVLLADAFPRASQDLLERPGSVAGFALAGASWVAAAVSTGHLNELGGGGSNTVAHELGHVFTMDHGTLRTPGRQCGPRDRQACEQLCDEGTLSQYQAQHARRSCVNTFPCDDSCPALPCQACAGHLLDAPTRRHCYYGNGGSSNSGFHDEERAFLREWFRQWSETAS